MGACDRVLVHVAAKQEAPTSPLCRKATGMMTSLSIIATFNQLTSVPDGYLSGPVMVLALGILGLGIGVMTGLFGVGGGFLVVPLLTLAFGLDYPLAIGSSLCFVAGTSAGGMVSHARRKNVEFKTTFILAAGSIVGAPLGKMFLVCLEELAGQMFTSAMDILFIALLIVVAILVIRRPPVSRSRTLLQRLPIGPHIDLPQANRSHVSLPGMCVLGLAAGFLTGIFGIGGGVILVPLLMVLVGQGVHLAIGTSLGIVLLSSMSGTVVYGLSGKVSLVIAMALLLGSAVGVQVGSVMNARIDPAPMRRYFAVLVVITAASLAVRLAWSLVTS